MASNKMQSELQVRCYICSLSAHVVVYKVLALLGIVLVWQILYIEPSLTAGRDVISCDVRQDQTTHRQTVVTTLAVVLLL